MFMLTPIDHTSVLLLLLVQKLVFAVGRDECGDSKPVKVLRIRMAECSALNRTSIANPILRALGTPCKRRQKEYKSCRMGS